MRSTLQNDLLIYAFEEITSSDKIYILNIILIVLVRYIVITLVIRNYYFNIITRI